MACQTRRWNGVPVGASGTVKRNSGSAKYALSSRATRSATSSVGACARSSSGRYVKRVTACPSVHMPSTAKGARNFAAKMPVSSFNTASSHLHLARKKRNEVRHEPEQQDRDHHQQEHRQRVPRDPGDLLAGHALEHEQVES